MLIERMYYLNERSKSNENIVVIENLKLIRRLLSKRLNKKIENLKRYGKENSDIV
jgi:hypothetical protein